MQLHQHRVSSSRSSASLSSTLRPLAWALGILIFSVAILLPEGLQAQVPQKAITECVTCHPTSVRATDVDGDGHTDVLSASSYDDKIAWYENDGSSVPNFTVHTITTNAGGPKSVYAANVDGDSDTDVLSASSLDDKITWYENDGSSDPSFTAHTITTNADRAKSVYAADVDGDSHTDILSASSGDDKIVWYENDGSSDPSFTTHTITTNADQAESVYAVDVDGDGHTDILSASSADSKIAWYENDGSSDPSFSAHTIDPVASGARSVHAADVDGDGDTDVLSASSGDDKIVWYENDGSSDPSFTTHTITTNADGAKSVYAADVDGDGHTDVFSASSDDDKIAWYENDGNSNPSFTAHTITTNAGEAQSVYAANVDGDSDTDVLSASPGDDKIAWHENDGSMHPDFSEHFITSPPFVNSPTSVYSVDVDGDNYTDVLSASFDDDKISWYENDGNSNPSFTAHTITTNASEAQSVYAANVDGDSDTDVLSASSGDITWYENDGTSDPSFTAHTIATNLSSTISVHGANVDGDSDIDVLSASSGDDKITWYENDGNSNPSFTAHTITTNAVRAQSVYAADVDGDSDTDVLSASSDDDKIAWYENDGNSNPSFTAHTITTNANGARSVHAADVDGDGDTDVLSASSLDGVTWYENDGTSDPSFTAHTINTSGAVSVHAANVDGDNGTDVLSASFYDDKIAWYENDGNSNPSFTAHTITTNALGAVSVHAVDVDGDDDTDVLSASQIDDKIAWYPNESGNLPVEFASLTARAESQGAQLTWQTASETNNTGFYIQHQTSSKNEWTRLGFVEGAGTTSKPQSYQFEVEDLRSGIHKFRLRQVDADGTVHLSRVVSTEIQMRKKARLTTPAPNPVASTARLTFAVKESEKATVTLYNTLGQRVARLYEGRPTPGEQVSLQFDTSTLGSGAYIVRLKAGSAEKTRKITVVK